jgi:glycosyltransferase involved in cell wall biosynthesis
MSQPLYLLYVGSVSTHKGAGRVVQIARELLNQRLSLELHVVGDGPERPSMETWVREQGLSP